MRKSSPTAIDNFYIFKGRTPRPSALREGGKGRKEGKESGIGEGEKGREGFEGGEGKGLGRKGNGRVEERGAPPKTIIYHYTTGRYHNATPSTSSARTLH